MEEKKTTVTTFDRIVKLEGQVADLTSRLALLESMFESNDQDSPTVDVAPGD